MDTQHSRFDVEDSGQRALLAALLLQLADDELVLGHRDSQWLGVAPEIEEDVAFSSISQDEVGHAVFFYELLASLGYGSADDLAFGREAAERKNSLLSERPNGDWALTIVRHYWYDQADRILLTALADTAYEPLRRGVVKIRREEHYHHLHLDAWFRRLALAGGEAQARMQQAVDRLWLDLPNLFTFAAPEEALTASGIVPLGGQQWSDRWLAEVGAVMNLVGLRLPGTSVSPGTPGRTEHTDELTQLLATMAEVYRFEAGAVW